MNDYNSNQNYNIINNILEKKSRKKNMIKPPFKKGIYSYKHSFNTFQNNNNNRLSYESPNYSNNHKVNNNNSSLSLSSVNLNKYKINVSNQNNINKNIINNNIIEYHMNNIKNTDLSMKINLNNINNNTNNNINTNNNYNLNQVKKTYKNQYIEKPKYFKESRRMIVELIKALKISTNNSVKNIMMGRNISPKIFNQKYSSNENNNKNVFGEEKKQLYSKNLNYSVSNESDGTNNGEDNNYTNENNHNDFMNMNNILVNNEKKKIDILFFLCVPRVLNLIGDNNTSSKYIFLVTLNQMYYLEGKESYQFQWRSMVTNEVENEFNLKLINSCSISNNFKNRFIIKLEKSDDIEIEAPTVEICENYIKGINYLAKLKINI
jgi:hypothetical protein